MGDLALLLHDWKNSSEKLLDTRPLEQFESKRLLSARSRCIPFHILVNNCFELPPREETFGVIATSEQFEEVINFLHARGWSVHPTFRFTDTPQGELWSIAGEVGVLETALDPIRPCFLCHPAPFLVEMIDTIERTLLQTSRPPAPLFLQQDELKQERLPPILTACDIGCGSGRDAVWLTCRVLPAPLPGGTVASGSDSDAGPAQGVGSVQEEAKEREEVAGGAPQWRVVGVDFVVNALQRLHTFAASFGVADRVQTQRAKILDQGTVRVCDGGSVSTPFHSCQYDLVIAIRFLEHNFLQHLPHMIRPGGFILYQTFTTGAEQFDHPKNPKHILEEQELNRYFNAESGFEILIDRRDLLPDQRPVQSFCARKLK